MDILILKHVIFVEFIPKNINMYILKNKKNKKEEDAVLPRTWRLAPIATPMETSPAAAAAAHSRDEAAIGCCTAPLSRARYCHVLL